MLTLHKKWHFPLRVSPVNVTKSAGNCGFVYIYWTNPQWKNSFFVQCNNIVISKFVEIKNNSKGLIGYLGEAIKPYVLILPKIHGYVETFKDKGEDKNKSNKLMPLRIDDEKLLEKHKTIWTSIEN